MRTVFRFHGGIHPSENKQQSLQTPIEFAGIPPELVIPLSQHVGAPASSVVAIGERVLKGQMIAESTGYISLPLHAPTSGTITAIEDRTIPHPSGYKAPCLIIATDGEDEWQTTRCEPNYQDLTPAELVQLLRDAGVAGMGGAGFPTAVKLSINPDVHIETLVINGTECEPYITADDALMRERGAQIIEGARILSYIINPARTLIGVEDNKPEGIASLRYAARDTGIDIVAVPTRYPSGGEKQLIEILTNKQVPSGGLPADIGVMCQNLGTTVAIHDAVIKGRPLISRITTVTGRSLDQPQNFEVLLGTPLRFLLSRAGYQGSTNNKLIIGGPMMGFTVPNADVPVVKTCNCLLAPTENELPSPPPAKACIRCGQCAEVCPASLLPQQLFWFAQGNEHEKLERHNLFDCIECGSCSWVCPSHIPLVQYYRAAKADIVLHRENHLKSEHARGRFEFRQARIAREVHEKQTRREARRQAALAHNNDSGSITSPSTDPVQAAIARAKARKAGQQKPRSEPESS